MEPIILVFTKLMGAAISGHWDLRDTGTTRDYDTLARSPSGCQGQALGGSRTKTSHSRQSVMLGCQNGCAHVVAAKRANNQGENVHIYLILLHRLC